MTSGLAWTDAIAVLALATGLFFTLTAVVGILRLPDFFTRLHAIGKCDTVGLSLSLLGLALLARDPAVAIKLALVLVLVAVANPTATHALARAARKSGLPIWGAEAREEPPGER